MAEIIAKQTGDLRARRRAKPRPDAPSAKEQVAALETLLRTAWANPRGHGPQCDDAVRRRLNRLRDYEADRAWALFNRLRVELFVMCEDGVRRTQ